mmetsp:Transcript_17364/g.33155  ORF Transcript_17364/g.33155 Transcript_17364/m.33155 type:complete len:507 (-) Transcript_17364:275-1795(-)
MSAANTNKEYGEESDDGLDDLVTPTAALTAKQSSSFSLDHDGSSNNFRGGAPQKSLLFYVATVQAFLIIYRTEVLLGFVLAVSVSIAFSSATSHSRGRRRRDPFQSAHISHDYSDVKSKYDLTLGSIDHWCLHGDDSNCRCEDPLEPMSKRSSHKWEEQHKENIKVATEALMKLTKLAGGGSFNAEDYIPGYDDQWIEGIDDDWVYGQGPRFGDDIYGYESDPLGSALIDDFYQDDGYGIPMENPYAGSDDDMRGLRRAAGSEYGLDVVFIGDSITEQRQGTSMGRVVDDYEGIKEVFDKTFTREKGGEFEGIAMGIAGDTAPNLLWRLMNGEMPFGLNPKVWWVGIGINDLSIKGCSEEVVLLGILRVVEEIQNGNPDAIVVINSILPVRRNEEGLLEHTGKNHEHEALKKKEKNMMDNEMDKKRSHEDLWPSIVSINEELSKFSSKHHGVKFFNADSVFVEEDEHAKRLNLNLMHDAVHPNVAGHKKWNNAIKKRLNEILKDGN